MSLQERNQLWMQAAIERLGELFGQEEGEKGAG
jgi:hypothetical protein